MTDKLIERIKKKGDKTNDIIKRLRSIDLDRMFVERELNKIPDIPVFANERCGNWYCHGYYNGTCYFKSTDGHRGKWSFNDRRLNIDAVIEAFMKKGLIIVDSTGNRKKKIPDSLSKTIPIWTYILNNTLGDHFDHIPISLPSTISDEEKDEIIMCLIEKKEKWINLLQTVLTTEMHTYLREISWDKENNRQRILIPVWVYIDRPVDIHQILEIKKRGDIPLILVSASDYHIKENWYLMGSADDEEMWSGGLTADTFYEYKELLLSCVNDIDTCKLIQQIIEKKTSTPSNIFEELTLFNGYINVCCRSEDDHIIINLLKFKSQSPVELIFDINLYQKLGIVSFLKSLEEFIVSIDKERPLLIYAKTKEIGMIVALGIILMNPILKDNLKLNIMTKSEIRRIISYVQHEFDLKHFSRDICKQFNIYFINNYVNI
jgi:hypothetical protein